VSQKKAPIVSVVVPVYNSSSTLDRAVKSVIDQTLRDIEILIIDDGSTDDSLSVATSLKNEDDRIRVIKLEKNGGKARAMNIALTQALGRWIALIDADDRYAPTRLQKMVEAGESQNVHLVADNQIHVDDANGNQIRQAFLASGQGREIRIDDFIAHSDTGGTFDFGILKIMLRADFVHEKGITYHPDAKFSEDFYFLVDFFCLGGRAWLIHEALYEWTLPFSPSKRRWTSTGNGAWRYDYRNALATNDIYKKKLREDAPRQLVELLHRRDKQYQIMVHYLDAQRALADDRNIIKSIGIIICHPQTWSLLARRITGRLMRLFS
jgi:succinoglycan biosynthesis protein ExoO